MTAFATTVADWKRSCRRRLYVGLLVGALIASACWYAAHGAPVRIVDPRMELACGTWPRYEAEQLTIVVIGGKVHCWNTLHRRGG